MSKVKTFVKKHKESILVGFGTAAAVLVGAAVVVSESKKDQVRFHRDSELLIERDAETDRLKLTFCDPDGQYTRLSYRTKEAPEEA